MARIRSIKPEFWTDEKIVELSPIARLFFIGLWNFVDDEGRCIYSPKRLKLQILPADNADVQDVCAELRRVKLITIYRDEEKEYLQVTNFSEHQKIDKRRASKIPAPNGAESHQMTTTDQGMDQGSRNGSRIKDLSPAESGRLFNIFWSAFPKKKSKGQAQATWKKLKPDEHLVATMIAKIETAKTSEQWTKSGGQFIPYPSTWLNNRGWEDEDDAPPGDAAGWDAWVKKHEGGTGADR